MKGLFTILTLLILISSCKESGVQLSKPSTFVRYFSDGNPNDAVDVLETSSDGGYLILSYSKADNTPGWINLTKTTVNGNTVWEKSIKPLDTLSDLKPSNFVPFDNGGAEGYLIVGTQQNPKFGSRLFIARVDIGGDLKDSISYHTSSGNAAAYQRVPKEGEYLIGKGVAQSKNADKAFFVIAEVVGSDLTTHVPRTNGKGGDMYLAKIRTDTTKLDTAFTHVFGAGTTELANRLYLPDDPLLAYTAFWGGTRFDVNGQHMVLIGSGYDHEPEDPSLGDTYPKGSVADKYKEGDFCEYGSFYGLIGSHVSPVAAPDGSPQYDSVVFVLANGYDGTAAALTKHFKLNFTQGTPPGGAICTTNSGGFMLLVSAAADAAGSTDYSLIKLDINGNHTKDWPAAKTYGGKYPDVGKRVLQSSDGGYVVLGTTTIANVNTVFLMKTDGSGKIQ